MCTVRPTAFRGAGSCNDPRSWLLGASGVSDLQLHTVLGHRTKGRPFAGRKNNSYCMYALWVFIAQLAQLAWLVKNVKCKMKNGHEEVTAAINRTEREVNLYGILLLDVCLCMQHGTGQKQGKNYYIKTFFCDMALHPHRPPSANGGGLHKI